MLAFDGTIVKKPWGYEYVMYQSEKIGIWYLHIMHGRQTSLHCHPAKKTGYILLSGEARVSFLNDATMLRAVSKLMIREGLFHSTKALSPDGIHVIEVESPPDKTNLVRLEDAYGRKEQPYEGVESLLPLQEHCVLFADPSEEEAQYFELMGAELVVEKLADIGVLQSRPPEEIILVMDGGLVSKTNDPIVSAGDVVTISTFNRLAETFASPDGVSLLTVHRASQEAPTHDTK